MFDSLGMSTSASDSGAYYSQSRGYLMGGSLTARSPTKYMAPLTVQLPDLKAGCGGVDMFFGGFQFINAEEFKRFLQNAGTAAVGYAFQMALEAVCPTCNSVLKSLRSFADSINKFGLDSCTAARAVMNTAGGQVQGYLQTAIAEEGQLSSSDGSGDGFWSPVKGWMAQMGKSVEQLNRAVYDAARNERKTHPRIGISTMENYRFGGINTLTEDQMELAISLLGTKAPTRGVGDSGSETPLAECREYMPLITVTDILEGTKEDNPLLVWRCTQGSFSDGSCERIDKAVITGFDGYRKYALDMLTGIKQKMRDGTPLSDTERSFIDSIPNVPVKSAITTALGASPSIADAMIVNISDLAAVSYAVYVVASYTGIYRQNAVKNTCGDAPYQRYAAVIDGLMKEFERYASHVRTVTTLISFLDTIGRANSLYGSKRLLASMTELKW